MAKSKESKKVSRIKMVPLPLAINLALGLTLGIIISLIASFLALRLLFADRIYPGIAIAGFDLSGLTKQQASDKLTHQLENRLSQELIFTAESTTTTQKVTLSLTNLESDLNLSQQVDQAFWLGHHRFYLPRINLNLDLNDQTAIDNKISQLTEQVDKDPIESQIKLTGEEINVTPSQEGLVVNKQKLRQSLLTYINTGQLDFSLPLEKAEPKLPYDRALILKKRLDLIKLEPLKLTLEDNKQTFKLDLTTLLSLLDLKNSPSYLDQKKTSEFISNLAAQIDKPVQEPLFAFDPSLPNKVKEFSPPSTGQKLDQTKTFELLAQALQNTTQKEISLPVETLSPKNKLTNDLGIKELIGQGKSSFEGSINNRIFNLKLAASRLNGILITPGETFSFLERVGDISEATGYKKAYVIKSGRTVLDDGGGVCQVSTTLFRTVLDSGVPVLERWAHAYRVGYYELGGYPPGLDATIYNPGVDFKFKNDTPGHILIQSFTEGNSLYVNFYGTSDGRVVSLTKPLITERIPPPPDLRQDDPTLPKGEVKQVEHAYEGAKVSFKRTVTKNGKVVIDETFKSNFRPWQAVYLVGTKEG